MNRQFLDAVKNRRSIYAISNETTITDEELEDLIKESVKYAPTAFHAQNSRVILLLGEHHVELWESIEAALRKVVPEESFAPTKEKMDAYRGGYGTILFYENYNVVEELQEKYPLYQGNFPIWSQQEQGIVQFIIWTALEEVGLGATLQHYTEMIEEELKEKLQIPKGYRLIGQMPFGKMVAPAGEKEFIPLDQRVKVLK